MASRGDRAAPVDDGQPGATANGKPGTAPNTERPRRSKVDIRALLLGLGVEAEEIERADQEGWLPLLVADRVVLPGAARYDRLEVAELCGVDLEFAERAWRALGFPSPPDHAAIFVDADVQALRLASELTTVSGPLDDDLHLARLLGAAMTRMSEAVADDIETAMTALRATGMDDAEISGMVVGSLDLEDVAELISYVFRRQLHAALWRRLAPADSAAGADTIAVGFIDLVRFTALTEAVPEDELSRIVTRFEELSHERITAAGGRIVKMIGDAVMFVIEDPGEAVQISLDLVAAYDADDLLPPARAGLSWGPVLLREGDYFGPVVNLASRLEEQARPSTVVVSDDMHTRLADEPGLVWRRLPARRLKGIGHPHIWRVRRADPTAADE